MKPKQFFKRMEKAHAYRVGSDHIGFNRYTIEWISVQNSIVERWEYDERGDEYLQMKSMTFDAGVCCAMDKFDKILAGTELEGANTCSR